MPGMLQILTWLLAFYLVIKGIEVLQIGLASTRSDRTATVTIGALTLGACIIAGIAFCNMQDDQARSISTAISPPAASSP